MWPGHALNQAGQHASDLLKLTREPGMRGGGQELEVLRKKEIILKFVTGTQAMPRIGSWLLAAGFWLEREGLHAELFVSERLDRIQTGCFDGRKKSKENPDAGGESDADRK